MGQRSCRQEWIEGTLELAAALAEARERFKSNTEFSHWLVDAGLDHITPDDRAALINMAADIDLALIVLQEVAGCRGSTFGGRKCPVVFVR